MTKIIKIPKNLYERLQVDSKAEKEVIHAAYRALAKRHDVNKAGNKAIMQGLNEAKEILLDEDKRLEYNRDTYGYGIDGIAEGSLIGNYRINGLIAEGGFGKTYKGEHVVLKEPVCIKFRHKDSVPPEYEKILLEEAKTIWDLRHHSLPAMRDLMRLEDGSFALVMSYIPGPTLEQIVEKNGKLDPENVAWITERSLSALMYLHYHGVVHGDVKPQNIIVQPDSHEIVLVDYGLSILRPSYDSKSCGYTPFFASPEQVKGKTLVPESDFYGLGMTMIFALGGDVGSKKVPSSTPDKLYDFIAKMITYDINLRPKWEDGNLLEELVKIREKAFGRKRSGMKKIPGFGG